MSGCSGGAGGTLTAHQLPAKEMTNALSCVKRVIGVVSGKGGVGKSLVTGLLAGELRRRGHRVGILDADITGPSVPKMFGVTGQRLNGLGKLIMPAESAGGIKIMSINLLLERETDPVIWRGPVIGGVIKQFWTETAWGELDYLLVDMPPGTGDVALTVFQSIPVDGLVIVTSPQDLVSMIVAKAVKMADTMNVPVLGLVENMSYLACPDCGKHIQVFGDSHVEEVSKSFRLALLAQIPINPEFAARCDAGDAESIEGVDLSQLIYEVEKIPESDDALGVGMTADGVKPEPEAQPSGGCAPSACASCPSKSPSCGA